MAARRHPPGDRMFRRQFQAARAACLREEGAALPFPCQQKTGEAIGEGCLANASWPTQEPGVRQTTAECRAKKFLFCLFLSDQFIRYPRMRRESVLVLQTAHTRIPRRSPRTLSIAAVTSSGRWLASSMAKRLGSWAA